MFLISFHILLDYSVSNHGSPVQTAASDLGLQYLHIFHKKGRWAYIG